MSEVQTVAGVERPIGAPQWLSILAVPQNLRDLTDSRATVVRLVFAACLMLFLELALIRWLGANIVHLSYFSNFVLLGSFLGIGAGFLISRKDWSIWPISLPLTAILTFCVFMFPISIERTNSEVIFFTGFEVVGPPAWTTLPVIFMLVATVLAGPAEMVGRCFGPLKPLSAYRWDLIGSLLGIASFTLLSFLRAPSLVWGIVALALFLLLSAPDRRIVAALWGTLLLIPLAIESTAPNVHWSPYYKLTTYEANQKDHQATEVRANGIPHQVMAPAAVKAELGEHIYSTPYERFPGNAMEDVLIIGAGSGSDVALALSKGAKNIDAVDIDLEIMNLGRKFNVDQPYADPAVQTYINDGRAYLESTDKKYDLILFALPDSLTLVSGASQIRLESFLFTEEALAAVRERLKDDGGFAMYNYYREDWLIDRLAKTAASSFGHTPCVDTYAHVQAVVSIAKNPKYQSCGSAWDATAATPGIEPSTDNAPFLYFKGDSFPPIYAFTLLAIFVATLVVIRALGGPLKNMRPYADLFFLGVAFMLLETKYIATFALLFGTTWLVNAMVFAGVLLIVLAAVETTRRFKTPPLPVVFALIALSLLAAWVVRPEWLLALPFFPRLVAASVLAFFPIYLANVAFAKRFRESADSRSAFAINLLGTILGGCLEYLALILGYSNLLIVVGLMYLAAFLLVPRGAAQTA